MFLRDQILSETTVVELSNNEALRIHIFPMTATQLVIALTAGLISSRECNLDHEYSRVRRASHGFEVTPGFGAHPATLVTWEGASSLCEAIGGRLLTVKEWQAIASNGFRTRYPWGDTPPSPAHANYGEHYGQTTEVCTFSPSEFGLYDLVGNVEEWCQDVFSPTPSWEDVLTEPGHDRCLMGGYFRSLPSELDITHISRGWPHIGGTGKGFRIAFDNLRNAS